MEIFSFDISPLSWALLGGAAVAAVAVLALLLPPLRAVARAIRRPSAPQGPADAEAWPGVSVVVCSQSDSSTLEELIPMIMAQDYPGPFEVVVVNDGADEGVNDVMTRMECAYSNVYTTYLPARSRNLSRRKLSITLGLKAARYDCVAILGGTCRLLSPLWLRLMMAPLACGDGLTVGYGRLTPPPGAPAGAPRRLMAFDTVRTAVQWLSAALAGRLYRACPFNMAYRRQLFFDRKGFAGTFELRFGDDDIFISSLARNTSYAVQLDPDAMVKIVDPSPARMHRFDRLRHDFTARYVSSRERLRWGAATLMWWLWTGCTAAATVTSLPSLVGAAGSLLVLLGLWLPLMLQWRRTARLLGSRPLCLTIAPMLWISPFYGLFYRILGRLRRKDNYTWSTVTD